MKRPTIYEALRIKLDREPTDVEIKTDVQRILAEEASVTLALMTEVNKLRAHHGFKPFSKYEFGTQAKWRREYRRVKADIRANKCPW